jgi:hypothetical protein
VPLCGSLISSTELNRFISPLNSICKTGLQEFKALIRHKSSCSNIIDFIPLEGISVIDFEIQTKHLHDTVAAPREVLLCQGYMSKRGRLNTAFQKRFFVLDGYTLKWYKSHQEAKKNPSQYLGAMNSRDMTVELGSDEDGLTFTIAGKQMPDLHERDLHLMVASVGERASWIQQLQAVAKIGQERGTGRRRVSSGPSMRQLEQELNMAALQAQNQPKKERIKTHSWMQKLHHKALNKFEALTGMYEVRGINALQARALLPYSSSHSFSSRLRCYIFCVGGRHQLTPDGHQAARPPRRRCRHRRSPSPHRNGRART